MSSVVRLVRHVAEDFVHLPVDVGHLPLDAPFRLAEPGFQERHLFTYFP